MRAYDWDKELHELEAPDIGAFRSWLLKNYSRDQAKKVLSSFHSALLEMAAQGILAVDPAQVSLSRNRATRNLFKFLRSRKCDKS